MDDKPTYADWSQEQMQRADREIASLKALCREHGKLLASRTGSHPDDCDCSFCRIAKDLKAAGEGEHEAE